MLLLETFQTAAKKCAKERQIGENARPAFSRVQRCHVLIHGSEVNPAGRKEIAARTFAGGMMGIVARGGWLGRRRTQRRSRRRQGPHQQ